jgi:hypothetical protein
MKSTTMGVIGQDDFLKCAHFLPERTYSSNKPQFAQCCRGGMLTPAGSPESLPHAVASGKYLLFRVTKLF